MRNGIFFYDDVTARQKNNFKTNKLCEKKSKKTTDNNRMSYKMATTNVWLDKTGIYVGNINSFLAGNHRCFALIRWNTINNQMKITKDYKAQQRNEICKCLLQMASAKPISCVFPQKAEGGREKERPCPQFMLNSMLYYITHAQPKISRTCVSASPLPYMQIISLIRPREL